MKKKIKKTIVDLFKMCRVADVKNGGVQTLDLFTVGLFFVLLYFYLTFYPVDFFSSLGIRLIYKYGGNLHSQFGAFFSQS